VLGGRRHFEERDLPDLHTWVDGDRQIRHIGEFQRQVAIPTCVNEARGAVYQKPEPPQRTLAFQSRDQVGRNPDSLEGRPEYELAGMKNESDPRVDFDKFGQVVLGSLGVDVGFGVVPKHAEEVVDPQVHRGRLNGILTERVDDSTPTGERLAYRDI